MPEGASAATVLVVDDDRGMLRLIEKGLVRDGHQPVSAGSGREAIEWLTSHRADLMLLDLKLQDIEGGQLLKQLAAIDRSVPFVIITGQGDERVAVEMIRCGALDYLVKDAQFLELLPAIVDHALAQIEKDRRLVEAERALGESEALKQAVIHSLPAHVAVLDGRGRIIAVNEAWNRFALANQAGDLTRTGVGTNYLDVCRRATAAGAPMATEALAGLEDVLAGRRQEFSIEYDCHSPTQERWYLMSLAAFNRPDQGAVVSHNDITRRRRAEEALRANERRLAADLDAMTRLQRLGTMFAHEGGWDQILGEVVATAVAITGADFGNLQLLDAASGDLRIAAHRGFPQWWLQYWDRVSKGQGACGTALDNGVRVIVEDVERSPVFEGTPALEIQQRAGVRAVLSTPLFSRQGRPLGVFSTHFKAPHHPDERTLRLLDLLGRQTADIIDRKQAEEALHQSEEALASFFAEAPVGLMWVGLDGVVQRVNDAQLEQLGRTAAEVLGHDISRFGAGTELKAILDAQATSATGVRNHRTHLQHADGSIRHVLIDVRPVLEGKRLVRSEWFVRDITRRVELEREILIISEREQRRFGRDLHDDLCQTLTGIGFRCDTLAQALTADSKSGAREAKKIAEMVRKTARHAREMARGLAPVNFESDGLAGALKDLARRTGELFDIECHFECPKPVSIDDEATGIHLYRIAQEAVGNAVKHGRPRHIEIRLIQADRRIVLGVKDDGRGLPRRARKNRGMGLRIMQYRSGVIGGSLVMQRGPTRGTEVVCTVNRPLPADPSPATIIRSVPETNP